MHRAVLIAFLFLAIVPVTSKAEGRVQEYMNGFQPVGTGRMSVLLMDIYDATYHRNIKGSKIADRSIVEMRKIGINDEIKLAAWHNQMRKIFPDVRQGTTLTGVLDGQGESIFFHDNKEIGRINDQEFGKAFFGIWLNEKTSAPQLRQKLLGEL
jgi:Chalcone isomerase-like